MAQTVTLKMEVFGDDDEIGEKDWEHTMRDIAEGMGSGDIYGAKSGDPVRGHWEITTTY